jgi:hypothetical protein
MAFYQCKGYLGWVGYLGYLEKQHQHQQKLYLPWAARQQIGLFPLVTGILGPML